MSRKEWKHLRFKPYTCGPLILPCIDDLCWKVKQTDEAPKNLSPSGILIISSKQVLHQVWGSIAYGTYLDMHGLVCPIVLKCLSRVGRERYLPRSGRPRPDDHGCIQLAAEALMGPSFPSFLKATAELANWNACLFQPSQLAIQLLY